MKATLPSSTAASVLATINALVKQASDEPKDPTLVSTSATAPVDPDGNDPAKLRIAAGTRPTNAPGVGDAAAGPVTQEPGALTEITPPTPASVGSPVQPANLEKRASHLLNLLNEAANGVLEKHAAAPVAPVVPETPAAAPLQKDAARTAALDAVADESLQDMLIKVGSAVLAHEGGKEFVERVLNEQIGANGAARLVAQTETLVKRAYAEEATHAALVKQAQDQHAFEVATANHELRLLEQSDPQGYASLQKLAGAHDSVMTKIASALAQDADFNSLNPEGQVATLQAFQNMVKQGSADMAAMLEAEQGGGAGAPLPEMPGAGGDAGPEEIIALLQELVAGGQLTEEQAQQIIAQLAGGMPPEAGGGMPPEMEKMAATLGLAQGLTEALTFIPDTVEA